MSLPDKMKSKKILFSIIKFLIIAISWVFIIYKIDKSPDLDKLPNYFHEISFQQLLLLSYIMVLMYVNWSIETLKWRYLVSRVEKISFIRSFKAVWSGVTLGTITPNRIGEFGGRIIFLKSENRHAATTLTLFGDLSQMLTTLIAGIIGVSYLYFNVIIENSILPSLKTSIFVIAIVLILICIVIFFNINYFLSKISKIAFLKKFLQKFILGQQISTKDKFISLSYSFLRYFIFSLQFYFSLRFFGIELSLINAFAAISSMYLAIHVIPNISAAEIGVRLSFAVIFIGLFTANHTAIGLASLLIYLINIVVPVIGGSIFIMKKKSISTNIQV